MATRPYNGVGYGLSEPLLNIFPAPIVSNRVPTIEDRAQDGAIWVIPSTNTAYMLTSIENSVSTWVLITNSSSSPIFDTDSGTAVPAANVITLHGAGDITTSGAGSTVTITGTGADIFDTDSGTALSSANTITIHGGTGITTAGSGNTVTITASGGSGITTLAGDVGTAAGSTVNVVTAFASGTPFFTGDNVSTLTWQIGDAHNNVGLGNGALQNGASFSSVNFNTAVGDSVANGIGANCTYNCFFGASAAANLGNRSGGANYNVAIGNLSIYQADAAASYNIGIGYLAGGNLQSNESSNVYLNSPGSTSESNTLRIGASSGTGNQQLSTAYVSGIHFVDLSTVEMVTVSGGDQLGSSTLTAGSGISITPGSGVITIASTGSGGIITIDGDSGSVTGSTVTISGGAPTNGTATFVASGSTLFLFFDNSGTRNLGLGDQALVDIGAGQDNVAIGTGSGSTLGSGSSNTLIGSSVGSSLTTGSNNCLLGALAGNSYAAGTESGNILINNPGVNGENNVLRIGAATGSSGFDLAAAYISGIRTAAIAGTAVLVSAGDQLGIAVSSQRFKNDIQDMGSSSDAIYNLRPVTFKWNKNAAPGLSDATQERQFGLIAEEVAEILPMLVNYEKDGTPLNIKYDNLPALLLNEIQKLNKRIDALEHKCQNV